MALSQKIAGWILKSIGWKLVGKKPQEKKYVFIVAPHTSNWDFIIGKLAAIAMGIDLKIAIKDAWFFPPVGWLLKGLGAVPVNRKRAGGFLKQVISQYKNADEYMFTVTPEGTRSFVKFWKAGFYKIAIEAQVPIVLGILDFAKKEAGVGITIYPSGDIQKDFAIIMSQYKKTAAYYPQNFNEQARIR